MPTLEQVEHEVLSAEGEMATAKAKKDYRRAAELSLKLPAMHDRHSTIASATRKAMNRKQLAEEVKRLEGEVGSGFLRGAPNLALRRTCGSWSWLKACAVRCMLSFDLWWWWWAIMLLSAVLSMGECCRCSVVVAAFHSVLI